MHPHLPHPHLPRTLHRSGVSRRQFLGLGAGALAAAGLVRQSAAAAHGRPNGQGPHVGEPQLLESRDGRLKVTLVAEERSLVVAGKLVKAIVYNGSFPAPTLVVEPGDRLDIRVVNHLHHPTNLHTHGVHVSPSGRSDNVFVHIEPGESFDFRIDVPVDHPPGLNWYHPHPHGHGAVQLFGGMAGALIVRARSEHRGGAGRIRERVMVLQTPEWDEAGDLVPLTPTTIYTQLRLVNGEPNPTIDIPVGASERWRFVNASPSSTFELQLEGHELLMIGQDGHFFRRPEPRTTVVIAPGMRADVLVTPQRSGTYVLRAIPYDEGPGFITPDTVLATVVSSGRGRPRLPALDPLLRGYLDLRDVPVDRTRTVTFSMRGGFTIDGKLFDPDRTDQVVELGALEEWTVVNDSPLVHPFHIHVNPFQLTHVNGQPVEVSSYQDTMPIDPRGSITFRTEFLDFTGRSLFHCHIAQHSDLGMTAVFEVVEPGRQHTGPATGHQTHGPDPEGH